jgi:hypothetical protein
VRPRSGGKERPSHRGWRHEEGRSPRRGWRRGERGQVRSRRPGDASSGRGPFCCLHQCRAPCDAHRPRSPDWHLRYGTAAGLPSAGRAIAQDDSGKRAGEPSSAGWATQCKSLSSVIASLRTRTPVAWCHRVDVCLVVAWVILCILLHGFSPGFRTSGQGQSPGCLTAARGDGRLGGCH